MERVIELPWQRWENPSISEQIQSSILFVLSHDGSEVHLLHFMRVYELVNDQLFKTDKVIYFDPRCGKTEVYSVLDIRFVEARDQATRAGQGFSMVALVDPEELAQLFEMLESASTASEIFRLYTNGKRAAIVREKIVEPEPAPAPKPKPALIEVGICPAGGKHQVFQVAVLSSGGFPVHQFWSCVRCCGTVINPKPEKSQ